MSAVHILRKTLSRRLVTANFRTIYSCATSQKMDDIVSDMRKIFLQSVAAVHPNSLVKSTLKVNDGILKVHGMSYTLNRNVYLVGFGKAVLGMATEAEKILGEHLVAGVVSVPQGILNSLRDKKDMLPGPGSILELYEGAQNNLPDANSEKAAMRIKTIAESAGEGSVLLVLVSGGGSALLPLPRPPVTLEEKRLAVRLLASAGADITELNCVRKKLSLLKGGGLARIAYPAQVVTLVLSDVICDPLNFIASGPTVINSDPPNAAFSIIHKYCLRAEMPSSVIDSLRKSAREPLEKDSFDHVQNVIIGNNSIALEGASEEASRCGYFPVILSNRIEGLVKTVGKMYSDLAGEICSCASGDADNISPQFLNSLRESYGFGESADSEIMHGVEKVISGQGLCLIAGGETTVIVRGNGLGGRNQELALEFAVYSHNLERFKRYITEFDVALLSCGTDGIDGPTTAAGAIGYSAQSSDDTLKPSRFLMNNDSHSFYRIFRGGSDLVTIGHTGTNVMDVHLLIVKKKI